MATSSRHNLVPTQDEDFEDDLESRTHRKRGAVPATEDAAITRFDLYTLGFLVVLVIMVLGRMAWYDHQGPKTDICDEEQLKIAKHLHCVSHNNTKSFAEFLAAQGAKKQHPNYESERNRLAQSRLQRLGNHNTSAAAAAAAAAPAAGGVGRGSAAMAAGRASDYLRTQAAKEARAGSQGGSNLAYGDDGVEHDFYDPDVKRAAPQRPRTNDNHARSFDLR